MKPTPGTMGWLDLRADDATGLRDFYAAARGWVSHDVAMGEGDEVVRTRDMGSYGTMAVCRDPAGHWFALLG